MELIVTSDEHSGGLSVSNWWLLCKIAAGGGSSCAARSRALAASCGGALHAPPGRAFSRCDRNHKHDADAGHVNTGRRRNPRKSHKPGRCPQRGRPAGRRVGQRGYFRLWRSKVKGEHLLQCVSGVYWTQGTSKLTYRCLCRGWRSSSSCPGFLGNTCRWESPHSDPFLTSRLHTPCLPPLWPALHLPEASQLGRGG